MFRARIYRAHRAVIFAIDQLSCSTNRLYSGASRSALRSSSVVCWTSEADHAVVVHQARCTRSRRPPLCLCTMLVAASHAASASSASSPSAASSVSPFSPSSVFPSVEEHLDNCSHSRYLLLPYPLSGLKTTLHVTAQTYVCHGTTGGAEANGPNYVRSRPRPLRGRDRT